MVLRQKYWIDGEVQGVLVGRVVVYTFAAVLYVVLGSIGFQYWQHPDWSVGKHASHLFQQLWPWLPSFLLLVPLVLHDVIRLSNMFVGPIYRLRVHLAELAANPACRPLKFREEDYWQDLVCPINYLQNEILALQMVVDGLVEKQADAIRTVAALNAEADELQAAYQSVESTGVFRTRPVEPASED